MLTTSNANKTVLVKVNVNMKLLLNVCCLVVRIVNLCIQQPVHMKSSPVHCFMVENYYDLNSHVTQHEMFILNSVCGSEYFVTNKFITELEIKNSDHLKLFTKRHLVKY